MPQVWHLTSAVALQRMLSWRCNWSFCSRVLPRKWPKQQIPPAAKAPRLSRGVNTLYAVQEAALLFLCSEDDKLLQLTALCEGCACLFLKRCMWLTLRSCIFSRLSPIKAWEFCSLAYNRHVTHMLHSGTDVSKYRLHHWHNLASCEKWKPPRHSSGGSVQHICIPTGFELMGPRGTKSIL